MNLRDLIILNNDLVSEKSTCPFYSKEEILKHIKNSVVFDINNVNNYVESKETMSYENLPYCIPPFPSVWFEHKIFFPKGYCGMPGACHIRHGYIVMAGDGKQDANDVMVTNFSISDLGSLLPLRDQVKRFGLNGFSQQFTAHYQFDKKGSLIKQYKNNGVIDKLKRSVFGIKQPFSYSNIFDKHSDQIFSDVVAPGQNKSQKQFADELGKDRMDGGEHMGLIICLLACSFMNCRNVSKVFSGNSSVFFDRNGDKIPETKIYTLTIEPIKKIYEKTDGLTGKKADKAFHICRGHFKDFSHGRGLFGQHKGTYWWPSSVRGDKKFGEIKKDYKLKIAA